jgi:hypothetical protein
MNEIELNKKRTFNFGVNDPVNKSIVPNLMKRFDNPSYGHLLGVSTPALNRDSKMTKKVGGDGSEIENSRLAVSFREDWPGPMSTMSFNYRGASNTAIVLEITNIVTRFPAEMFPIHETQIHKTMSKYTNEHGCESYYGVISACRSGENVYLLK